MSHPARFRRRLATTLPVYLDAAVTRVRGQVDDAADAGILVPDEVDRAVDVLSEWADQVAADLAQEPEPTPGRSGLWTPATMLAVVTRLATVNPPTSAGLLAVLDDRDVIPIHHSTLARVSRLDDHALGDLACTATDVAAQLSAKQHTGQPVTRDHWLRAASDLRDGAAAVRTWRQRHPTVPPTGILTSTRRSGPDAHVCQDAASGPSSTREVPGS